MIKNNLYVQYVYDNSMVNNNYLKDRNRFIEV